MQDYRKKGFQLQENHFDSVRDFANQMGLRAATIYQEASRDKLSGPEECEKIFRRMHSYRCDGKWFQTKAALCSRIGISTYCFNQYLSARASSIDKANLSKEDILQFVDAMGKKAKKALRQSTSKAIRIDGKEWPTVKAFADEIGIYYNSISFYAKAHNITVEERAKQLYYHQHSRTRVFFCDGKTFRTRKELADYLETVPHLLDKFLHTIPPKTEFKSSDWIDFQKKKELKTRARIKQGIVYGGTSYYRICDLARSIGASYSSVQRFLTCFPDKTVITDADIAEYFPKRKKGRVA